jgi:signal transduction histidine kinase
VTRKNEPQTGSPQAPPGLEEQLLHAQAYIKMLERALNEKTNEAGKRARELEALYQAEEIIYRTLQIEQVLQSLVDLTVTLLGADKSALFLWDAQRKRFVIRYSCGISMDAVLELAVPRRRGAVSRVAATGSPVVVEDTHTDPLRQEEDPEVIFMTEMEGIRAFMQIPLQVHQQVFGVFAVIFCQPHTFSGDEQRLFIALAQRAALAVENAQLYEQAQQVAAVEERNRLARELHDAVTQTLFSASLIADVLPELWEIDAGEGRQMLTELRQLSRGALAEMRSLLLELRPGALAEASLPDLLRQLADAAAGRTGASVDIRVEGWCNPPPNTVQVSLYRIAQEALNNVIKHARATLVEISLRCDGSPTAGLELVVRDNGRGFDPGSTSSDHLGLEIMRERAREIGAKFAIQSRPGTGTDIIIIWKGQP